MKQDTVEIKDDNAEKIIDAISANLLGGKVIESNLEKMVWKLCNLNLMIDIEYYVKCRNKIIEYIQSFYV